MLIRPGAAGYQCVACRMVHATRHEAFMHLAGASDRAHVACRSAEASRSPTAGMLRPPESRAGAAGAGEVAAQAASADPAAADRASAIEEQHRRQETSAEGSLYAAAKMGHVEATRRHLARGADPNQVHDDGFTPLMTAAEAGHALVVGALAAHPACELRTRNAYGQTALHFAAQNGRAEAARALLDAAVARKGGCDGWREAPPEAPREALLDGGLLAAKAGGKTAADAARLAGHTALASELAARATPHQLQSLLHELTSPPLGRRWRVVTTAPSANPDDRLDPREYGEREYGELSGALRSKQQAAAGRPSLEFTEDEWRSLRLERLRPGQYLWAGGVCYAAEADFGSASGPFDSIDGRIAALCAAFDLPLAGGARRAAGAPACGLLAFANDDDDEAAPLADGLPLCSVCLVEHVDSALTPCFHTSFCATCAELVRSRGQGCPICRGRVRGVQRIYL